MLGQTSYAKPNLALSEFLVGTLLATPLSMLQQVHCDHLISALFPFAQQMLGTHGEFFPFGAFVNAAGAVEQFSGYTGTEHPKPQELIELMSRAARRMAAEGRCRAVGMCVDVRTVLPGTTERTDAALAALEDATGALNVYLPYRKQTDGGIEYGSLVAVHANPTVFAQSSE